MERANATNVHPGIILKEDVIEANDLSIGTAADLLGIYRITLSKIVNTKGSITPNIALSLFINIISVLVGYTTEVV